MQTRQAEYARKLRGRFGAINAEQRRGIVDRGIFDDVDGTAAAAEQLASDWRADELTAEKFQYDDPAAATERFMEWLERQHEAGVLDVIERNDNVYIRRALSDGDRWALARLREAGDQGARSLDSLPPQAFEITVRGDAQFAQPSFNVPMPASTARLLFNRNYRLLEGITTDVETEMQRILSEGLVAGESPNKIARSLSGVLNGEAKNRATLTARHEIMYAHNTGAKERFRARGVADVEVLGSDPCPLCEPYVGETYPIDDLPQGGPPFHPQCVGTIVPAAGTFT
jgi:SPP1 gp7 family putative phage head morphogenesis protein